MSPSQSKKRVLVEPKPSGDYRVTLRPGASDAICFDLTYAEYEELAFNFPLANRPVTPSIGQIKNKTA